MAPVEGAALGLESPSADGTDEHDDDEDGGGGGSGAAATTPGGSKYAVYAKAARVLVGRAAHVGKEVGKVGLRHAAVGARAALKNVNSRLSGKVDMAEAMQRIERDARDARGEMRKSKLRAWCQVRLVPRPAPPHHPLLRPCRLAPLCVARWRGGATADGPVVYGSVRVDPLPPSSNLQPRPASEVGPHPLVRRHLRGRERCCVFQRWV